MTVNASVCWVKVLLLTFASILSLCDSPLFHYVTVLSFSDKWHIIVFLVLKAGYINRYCYKTTQIFT